MSNPTVSSGTDTETPGSLESTLEEIAEDMVHSLERLRSIEQVQEELAGRIERMDERVSAQMTTTRRTLSAMRRDLLEEGKARATRHAFDATAPVLDSMRALLGGLDAEQDAKTATQLRAVIASLSNLLQGLGYEEFESTVGEPFTPTCMECLGFADGDPGIVLEVVRPGYRAGGSVIRPAGVWIAEPSPGEETRDTDIEEGTES